jgi:spermidine/putrescine transport system substrate-binding protein
MGRRLMTVLLALPLLIFACLSGCDDGKPPEPAVSKPSLAKELVFYSWAEYMPQAVLHAFAREYGVKVVYELYDSTEAAAANIRAGKRFDLATMENNHLLSLVKDGLITKLDYRNLSNFKNISPNFRDLIFDPGNEYSVPYNWGTTGLLVRSDLVQEPVTRWADLWNPLYAGKIIARPLANELIGIALKSLGYSRNSLDAAQLQAAQDRLLAFKPALSFVEVEVDKAIAKLISGEATIMIGWMGDGVYASGKHPAIRYVFPEEGALLWGDSFIISANSPNQYTAEVFLNYLLRPEISAQIVNEYFYATANEPALPFIQPEISGNPIVFPPKQDFEKTEWYSPINPEMEKRHADIWNRFSTGDR